MQAVSIDTSRFRELYTKTQLLDKQKIAHELGSLQATFLHFLRKEEGKQAIEKDTLFSLFSSCTRPDLSPLDIKQSLELLAPGNGHIGIQEVLLLVDYLREKVKQYTEEKNFSISNILQHHHIFGSGGDFRKTPHASTYASLLVSPLLTVCKTGTTEVTSASGSVHAINALGYKDHSLSLDHINKQLDKAHFAFVPLGSLGFPYSTSLKVARKMLWVDSMQALEDVFKNHEDMSWEDVIRNTDVTIDIFKIVSPNAQVLSPLSHITGVPHLSMIPYVLAVYLHLGSEGVIVHSYEGVDELSVTGNNLIVQITKETITICTFSAEDMGLTCLTEKDYQKEDVQRDTQMFLDMLQNKIIDEHFRQFLLLNASVLLLMQDSSPKHILDKLKKGKDVVSELIASDAVYEHYKTWLSWQ